MVTSNCIRTFVCEQNGRTYAYVRVQNDVLYVYTFGDPRPSTRFGSSKCFNNFTRTVTRIMRLPANLNNMPMNGTMRFKDVQFSRTLNYAVVRCHTASSRKSSKLLSVQQRMSLNAMITQVVRYERAAISPRHVPYTIRTRPIRCDHSSIIVTYVVWSGRTHSVLVQLWTRYDIDCSIIGIKFAIF